MAGHICLPSHLKISACNYVIIDVNVFRIVYVFWIPRIQGQESVIYMCGVMDTLDTRAGECYLYVWCDVVAQKGSIIYVYTA